MKSVIRFIAALIIGGAVFSALFFTPARQHIIALTEQRGLNLGPLTDFPVLIPALLGAAAFVLVFALYRPGTGKKKKEKDDGASSQTEQKNRIGADLDALIEKHAPLAEHRTDTDDWEEIYRRREEDCAFAAELAGLLRTHEPVPQVVTYESGLRPDLLIEEVRRVLRAFLYTDVSSFNAAVDTEQLETAEISWPLFEGVIGSIQSMARSMNGALTFYTDMCRNERKKVANLGLYRILPVDAAYPEDADIYMLDEEKKLGEGFNYSSLISFRSTADEIGIPVNPSIPEAFFFVDRCVGMVIEPLQILLRKARPLFRKFEVVRTEVYQRIRWIYDNTQSGSIAPESAEYYRGSLKTSREPYTGLLKKWGFPVADPPEPFFSPQDFKEMDRVLETLLLKDKDSKVIYETGPHKKPPDISPPDS
jgi:hypothetical protein